MLVGKWLQCTLLRNDGRNPANEHLTFEERGWWLSAVNRAMHRSCRTILSLYVSESMRPPPSRLSVLQVSWNYGLRRHTRKSISDSAPQASPIAKQIIIKDLSTMSHNTLGNGEWLLVGNSLFSQDGSVEFKMQGDGKIAIYSGGTCKFQNTANQRSDVKGIKMQEDGNLCM